MRKSLLHGFECQAYTRFGIGEKKGEIDYIVEWAARGRRYVLQVVKGELYLRLKIRLRRPVLLRAYHPDTDKQIAGHDSK